MINVAALRPSDIERLSDKKLSDEDRDAIIDSVRTMLAEVVSDGGADTDRIYMAAQMLDMAGVWDQVSADRLAGALVSSPRSSRTSFLQGLPHRYAAEVALQILTARAETEDFIITPLVGANDYVSIVEKAVDQNRMKNLLASIADQRYSGQPDLLRLLERAAGRPSYSSLIEDALKKVQLTSRGLRLTDG